MDNKHPSPRSRRPAGMRVAIPVTGIVLGSASLVTGFALGVGVVLSVTGLVLSIVSMRRGVRWALAGVVVSAVGVAFCVLLPTIGQLALTFLSPIPED